MAVPPHGSIVTQAHLDASELGRAWFAAQAVGGFGKGAFENLVGMTNYVVNTTAQSGARSFREAYEANANYLIWFDDALAAEFTITHTTRVNAGAGRKVIACFGHRVTLAGRAIQHVGRAGYSYGALNMILNPTTDDEGWYFLGGGTGRVTMGWVWGEVYQPGVDPANAEQIDQGQAPSQGYYSTISKVKSPVDGIDSKGIILGNIGEGAQSRHSRYTMYRNDLGSRVRQPLATDSHVIDIESIHRVRLYAMEARNSNSGQLFTEFWLQNPLFLCDTVENTGNVAGLLAINDARCRVDGARYLGGSTAQQNAVQANTSQNRSGEVNIFVDESGASLAAYDQWRAGSTQLAQAELEGYIGWVDSIALGGTLDGAADGDVSGLTVTWTAKVDNLLTTTAAKNALLAGLSGGAGLTALLATVTNAHVSVSGKVATLTFPGGSTLTTSGEETLTATVPYTAQTRGRTVGTSNAGIVAGTGAPAPPRPDASLARAFASIIPGLGR